MTGKCEWCKKEHRYALIPLTHKLFKSWRKWMCIDCAANRWFWDFDWDFYD